MGNCKGFFADQHFVADLGSEMDYAPQYVDCLDVVAVAMAAAAKAAAAAPMDIDLGHTVR